MKSFLFELSSFSSIGKDLYRPECVLATKQGNLFASDWRGGVAFIQQDGSQKWILANNENIELKPNGIALEKTGSFLIANLSDDNGGVYRLYDDGQLDLVVDEIENKKLPATNFVMVDHLDRIWITVSTRLQPRSLGYRKDVADGFIMLLDEKGSRIVADELGYTNEVRLSPCKEWLYVVETFGRRLSRFKIYEQGILGKRETVTEFGKGVFPDGLAFDCEGGIWITSIISNRLIRLDPSGEQQVLVEDADSRFLEDAESAFLEGKLDRPHLDSIASNRLKNISSLAFGGPDLKTIYLGCLLGDSIATIRSPIAGIPPIHWNFDFC